jgi:hypothetical protein
VRGGAFLRLVLMIEMCVRLDVREALEDEDDELVEEMNR